MTQHEFVSLDVAWERLDPEALAFQILESPDTVQAVVYEAKAARMFGVPIDDVTDDQMFAAADWYLERAGMQPDWPGEKDEEFRRFLKAGRNND